MTALKWLPENGDWIHFILIPASERTEPSQQIGIALPTRGTSQGAVCHPPVPAPSGFISRLAWA